MNPLGALHRRLGQLGWWPHVPLGLGVLALGLFQLGDLVHRLLAGGVTLHNFVQVSVAVFSGIASGAHRVISGVFSVTMGGGLMLRSRLAWTVMVLLLPLNLLLPLALREPLHPALQAWALLLWLLLLRYRASFSHRSFTTATIFSAGSVLLLIAYGVFGAFFMGDQFKPPIDSLEKAMYFAVVTMSTVGYGDIIPTTPEARLYVVSLIIIGITVFATSISTVVVPLVNRRFSSVMKVGRFLMTQSDHYVIVSNSALARNTGRQLVRRGEKTVFIVEAKPDNPEPDVQYVVGSASNTDVLRNAAVETAQAVLALGEDDANNAFVVLAVRELSQRPKTVIAVNDTRNLARVQLVSPDMVIAPTILGSELLAMAMTNEQLDGTDLVGKLFPARGKAS